MDVEAQFYEKLEDDKKVQCHLCPHECRISPGHAGFCRARINQDGRLFAATYGKVAAMGMDPIEKKPLYHFHPGAQIMSIGTQGCTFRCPWCQNWQLVDFLGSTRSTPPSLLVDHALSARSIGIAYTYNEPWTFYEYVYDASRLAADKGLKNVLVTNGYFMPEPLEKLLPYIDAMNIDLKSIRPDFYETHCRGALADVQRSIERSARSCLVELTNLLITGENDSEGELRAFVDYVASVNPDMPVHFSRYRPMYKFNAPPTPESSLMRAYEIAREKLNFVYIGNIVGIGGENTECPGCRAVLISRFGYDVRVTGLKDGACAKCGKKIPIVM